MASQYIVTELKRICIECQQLLCLVNSQDIMYYIIKFGMISQYPELRKHLEDKLTDPEVELANAQTAKERQIAEIKKFIEQIAMQRQEQALKLITAYHEKQKQAVYSSSSGSSLVQIPLDKDEKLIDLDDVAVDH